MTRPAEGEYTVAITGPEGEWCWTGYADNRTDALARAELSLPTPGEDRPS
jgi:hypothetical protein